ncbi:MAG: DUF1926 domain-containing protein [Treponema sp.]|nr:DUF1926 domain-containing protein [Treponema sp.]
MNSIYVCFTLKSVSSILDSTDILDKNYQSVYKPIAKFLYSHPSFPFSFVFSGNQIQFFKKRRNELISIFRELVDRKQIEVIGGGYYEPILPLLFSVDRNGQIDMLSAEMRQTMGKRPRGISLFADCWDSSLVNNLQTCGIEYALLDSTIVPLNKRKYLPLIMTDLGKSVEILTYYDSFIPDPETTVDEFVDGIIKAVEKVEKKDSAPRAEVDRIVNIGLSHEHLVQLMEAKWFEKLYDFYQLNPDSRIKFSTPSEYRKNSITKIPAYIQAGINGNLAKWIGLPLEDDSKQNNQMTVFDFMEKYPQSHALYNRVLYVSMMVNQYKNDKMRKKSAREKLWQGQRGLGFVSTSEGAFANSRIRQQSYKYLMEAEKILREDSSFKESLSCFDYNGDGMNEYVCRMQNYFSYITLTGGAVQELELIKNSGNYVDNLTRSQEYDEYSDDYDRGIFIDHVFTEEQFEKYINAQPAGDGIFSRVQYVENKCSLNKHEVHLSAEACLKSTKQKVSLRKKYIINSTGMNIQYILKNESTRPLSVFFAVESNFANTNFIPEAISYFNVEVVNKDEILLIDAKKSTKEFYDEGKLDDISIVRLADSESGTFFSFEPNENCGYCYYPIIFKRPGYTNKKMMDSGMTFVSTLYWKLNLDPGMETEKNINFTITNTKKGRK